MIFHLNHNNTGKIILILCAFLPACDSFKELVTVSNKDRSSFGQSSLHIRTKIAPDSNNGRIDSVQQFLQFVKKTVAWEFNRWSVEFFKFVTLLICIFLYSRHILNNLSFCMEKWTFHFSFICSLTLSINNFV